MRGPRQHQETRYQRFVGAELAEVLDEVQRTHGPRATIVSVDRVRHGGVAGFFSREAYEVLVDGAGTEPTAAASPDAVPPPALSFADLLARRLADEDLRPLDDPPPPSSPSPPEAWADDDEVEINLDDDTIDLDPDAPDGPVVPDGPGSPDDLDGPDPAPADGPPVPPPADAVPATPVVPVVPLAPVAAPVAGARPRLGSVDDWSVVGLDHRLFATPPVGVPDRLAPTGSRSALEFWAGFDRARLDAELLAIPAVAMSAIVGELPVVEPVVGWCRQRHWSGQCPVYVLTDRRHATPPGWRVVTQRDELVAIVDRDPGEFPLLVIDVPPTLPGWLRPLLDRLRASGLGLVHHVLDGNPTDEDLATWHGEIGRPAVLDLVNPVTPARALDLVDRGEPLASIAGVPVTADLVFALRTEVSCAR